MMKLLCPIGCALVPVTIAIATPALAEAPTATPSRVTLALRAEPAFGVSGGSFYNQLVGARASYRFADNLSLGPYIAYANLKGQDGRAHNVLPSLELEYRVSLGASSAFKIPLRFATGYLPMNGPVMRLSAGIGYALSPHVDIVLDLLTPTFWVIRDRTVASLGAGFEIGFTP
jgi:hypothetical protein